MKSQDSTSSNPDSGSYHDEDDKTPTDPNAGEQPNTPPATGEHAEEGAKSGNDEGNGEAKKVEVVTPETEHQDHKWSTSKKIFFGFLLILCIAGLFAGLYLLFSAKPNPVADVEIA
jgi:hypothetical protein